MGKTGPLVALALVFVAASGAGYAQDDAKHERAFGRYVMATGAVPRSQLEAIVHLGDQLVDELRQRWGGDPLYGRGRIVVRVHATRTGYLRALDRTYGEGASSLPSIGWASYGGGACDVCLQPDERATLSTALHELTHVVQTRLCGCFGGSVWIWYREGLAVALSQYTVRADGRARFGVLDRPVEIQRSRAAAQRVAEIGYDPVASVRRMWPLDYVEAYALVGAMSRLREPDLAARWAEFEKAVSEGAHEGMTFVRIFRPHRLRLAAAIRRVWAVDGPPRRRP